MNKLKIGSLITTNIREEVINCVLVVYEVVPWGCKAQLQLPNREVAPFRLCKGEFTIVGEIPEELVIK